MCLWDWKSGALLMKTRAAVGVLEASTLHFATDGSFFVSGGVKHLKQWTIGGPRARSSGMTTNPGMDGRPIKLGSQKESTFVSVSSAATSREQIAGAPAYQPVYALTSFGDEHSSGVISFFTLSFCGGALQWLYRFFVIGELGTIRSFPSLCLCACVDRICRQIEEFEECLPGTKDRTFHVCRCPLSSPSWGGYRKMG